MSSEDGRYLAAGDPLGSLRDCPAYLGRSGRSRVHSFERKLVGREVAGSFLKYGREECLRVGLSECLILDCCTPLLLYLDGGVESEWM